MALVRLVDKEVLPDEQICAFFIDYFNIILPYSSLSLFLAIKW